jgi:predicted kinase
MMGLPGSGKTTWAKRIAAITGAIIVGRDDIRYILRHNHIYDGSKRNKKFVWDISQYMIKESLQRGFDIILDQMSLTSKNRKDTVDLVKKYAPGEIRILVLHCTEEENNVERRMKSDMAWGDEKYYIDLMNKLKKEIEFPDSKKEGFDGGIIISPNASIDEVYSAIS